MRLLLDTHALLWALASPDELPPRVRALLEDGSVEVLVSAASIWEVAIKQGMGKLEVELPSLLAETRTLGFSELRISFEHAQRAGSLPPHHRDPFDRMLIAQAMEEGLAIVTRDPSMGLYSTPTLWE